MKRGDLSTCNVSYSVGTSTSAIMDSPGVRLASEFVSFSKTLCDIGPIFIYFL